MSKPLEPPPPPPYSLPTCSASGLELPPETNPADWILDVTTSSQDLANGKTLSELYQQRNFNSLAVRLGGSAADEISQLWLVTSQMDGSEACTRVVAACVTDG